MSFKRTIPIKNRGNGKPRMSVNNTNLAKAEQRLKKIGTCLYTNFHNLNTRLARCHKIM